MFNIEQIQKILKCTSEYAGEIYKDICHLDFSEISLKTFIDEVKFAHDMNSGQFDDIIAEWKAA